MKQKLEQMVEILPSCQQKSLTSAALIYLIQYIFLNYVYTLCQSYGLKSASKFTSDAVLCRVTLHRHISGTYMYRLKMADEPVEFNEHLLCSLDRLILRTTAERLYDVQKLVVLVGQK